MKKRGVAAPTWWIAAIGVTLAIAASDGALLELTRGGFGNGFGGVLLDSAALRIGYFALTSALAAFALLILWCALAPLSNWAGQPPHRTLAICVLVALGAALWANVFIYQIHTIVGALVTPGVVRELAGASGPSLGQASMLADASTLAGGVLAIGAGLSVAGLVLVLRGVDRLVAHRPAPATPLRTPRLRTLALATALAAAVCTTALAQRSEFATRLSAAVEFQPTAMLFTALTNRLTDFDRDGSGLLSRPSDPAPFDAQVHGFALDLRANRVDENRLAGDLPAATPVPRPTPLPTSPPKRRPHVLVVYLESFRRDLLGLEYDGRPVTPFLDSLAREGASSNRMFVHSPYTARSRAQLFGGTLAPQPGQRTWIDDFRELGYYTAHFSGQDDSFGNSEPLLGVARADRFYDARSDTALRTSRSTAPASLQISWKLLLRRVASFLETATDAPLFLFVNIVDTHYPYHHGELETLLPGEPVDRSGIRSHNREQVWRTYLNAAANVDRATDQLVTAFRAAIGDADHVVLITADHGQAFYEDGPLGHGHQLDRRQTQVPLIAWGLGGSWPEPIGASDLRGLLLGSLDAPRAAHPEFAVDPQRRLLQYMPNLERPDRIAWRSADDAIVYDFKLGRAQREDGTAVELDDPEVINLIHAWEALQLETAEAQSDSSAQSRGRKKSL